MFLFCFAFSEVCLLRLRGARAWGPVLLQTKHSYSLLSYYLSWLTWSPLSTTQNPLPPNTVIFWEEICRTIQVEGGLTKGECGHAESPTLLSGSEILRAWGRFFCDFCIGPSHHEPVGLGGQLEKF